ncbi:MAG TPA: DUF167 domain-containing protein [Acidimicrobiales bacterium]|nr:DUF167 domain-containing protein [Acidimicrobiales bacterium]
MLSSEHDHSREATVRFTVRVHPSARVPRVTSRDGVLEVYVRSPAREGRATGEARAAVADALGVATGRVSCVHGEHSRTKLFAVAGDDDLHRRLALLLES